MSLTASMFCMMARRSDARRDAGLTTPADVIRFDEISYGPDAKWNRLDVYRPRGREGALPVIVSVHGGGWVYGDKELYQYYCMSLAQQGFAVVNFSYRLAPRHKFPAALEDTNRVFAWLLANAQTYGFDTESVFAVGDSAGAQLLGLFCCLCTNADYAASFPFRAPEGFVPRALALNCGVYRLERNGETKAMAGLMRDLFPQKGTAEELRLGSVIDQLTPRFPPSFVMTAEGDFLAGQAKPLTEALQAIGVRAEYHYYGDAEQVLGHVFHCNMRSEQARRCNRDECEFFRGFLPEQNGEKGKGRFTPSLSHGECVPDGKGRKRPTEA